MVFVYFRDTFGLAVNVFGLVGIVLSFLSLVGVLNSHVVVRWIFFSWSIITTVAGFSRRYVTRQDVSIDTLNAEHFVFVRRLAESQGSNYKIVFNDSRKDAGLYYKNFYPEVLSGCGMKLARDKFRFPDVVDKYADDVIEKLNSDTVNEKKVRLCTDLQRIDRQVEIILQRTSYFDDRVTNNFAKYRLRFGEETILGHGFMVDWNGGLIDLEHASNLSNQLGGSTLLLTADKIIVLSEQSRGSQENPSRFASTGSGSFDWLQLVRLKRQRTDLSFVEFAVAEIERELAEEVAFDQELQHKTFLVGYGRYLYQNGKPEIFGFTVTQQSARTLKVRDEELAFLEKHLDRKTTVDTLTSRSVLLSLNDLLQRMLLLSKDTDRASVPLIMNIETAMDFLKARLDEGRNVIAEFYTQSSVMVNV